MVKILIRISNLHFKASDRMANQSFTAFSAQVDLYDCRIRYSLWNCSDCRVAYATWVCAKLFQPCVRNSTATQPVCRDLCFNGAERVAEQDETPKLTLFVFFSLVALFVVVVVRKCPPNVEFTCPLTGDDYADGPDCFSMGLPSAATRAAAATVAVSVTVALLGCLLAVVL